VAEAKKNPELELYHSITIKVVGDKPRFRSFFKPFAEKMN
jgi:hypothetical protein